MRNSLSMVNEVDTTGDSSLHSIEPQNDTSDDQFDLQMAKMERMDEEDAQQV
jgi:hypothetical protein